MDWKKEVQKALAEKRLVIGLKKVIKNLKESGGKLVVVARNCPEKERLAYYASLLNIPLIEYPGNGHELGAFIKKPFAVSAILVR